MTKEQAIQAMHEQKTVTVDGYDGIFAIVEVNLLLKTVGLVRLTDDDGIPDLQAKFEDIEVAE